MSETFHTSAKQGRTGYRCWHVCLQEVSMTCELLAVFQSCGCVRANVPCIQGFFWDILRLSGPSKTWIFCRQGKIFCRQSRKSRLSRHCRDKVSTTALLSVYILTDYQNLKTTGQYETCFTKAGCVWHATIYIGVNLSDETLLIYLAEIMAPILRWRPTIIQKREHTQI